MSHDPQNPISNETGEYLQEVAEKVTQDQLDAQDELNRELKEDKPKAVKRTRK